MELAWRECIPPLSSAQPISYQHIQKIHPELYEYIILFITTSKEGIAVMCNVIQSGVLALPCIENCNLIMGQFMF
jgi:hypothetical protein